MSQDLLQSEKNPAENLSATEPQMESNLKPNPENAEKSLEKMKKMHQIEQENNEDAPEQKKRKIDSKEKEIDKDFIEKFFICLNHHVPCLHFCYKCNKLICAYDFIPPEFGGKDISSVPVPRKNEKIEVKPPELCCKHYDQVVPLQAFQRQVEQNLRKAKGTIDELIGEIGETNDFLQKDIENLQNHHKNNSETANSLRNFQKTLESLINSKPEGEIDQKRIFSMMKLVPECENLLAKCKITKDERFNELDAKINEFQKEIDEKNSIILETQKKLNEISKDSANYQENYLKQKEICEKLHRENEKNTEILRNLRISHENLSNFVVNLKNSFQNLKMTQIHSKPAEFELIEIKASLIYNGLEQKQLKNIQDSLSSHQKSRYFDIKLSEPIDISGQDEDSLKIDDFKDVNCIFLCSVKQFPEWFGNLLKELNDKGKGIVITECLTRNDEFGIKGAIEHELPFEKGPQISSDGPFFLQKIISNHPILKGIENFNGGKASWRSRIKVKPENPEDHENISLVAAWDDELHTPLIITKESLIPAFEEDEDVAMVEKNSKGNIAILNFWPVSDEVLDKFYWDKNTDGAKILQNAIFWASKEHQKLEDFENKRNSEWNNFEKLLFSFGK